ncbi:F-box/kelch-repeat protein At3g06240-like [Rosa rugosa]|uniref:F-box/kelch-repeat protein At3g06240-like n=1 Tax=Rosa rugosa TaxID=74645 RepID=UPI002B415A4E|nr:F-box/kelch-repeat protein At3g06240-like [Rosa rugosa]
MARKDELEKRRQQNQLVPSACGGCVLKRPPFDDEYYYQSLDTGSLKNDIIIEILKRLPAKSLLRFRAVCKSWCAFISNSSNFSRKHLSHAVTDSSSFRVLYSLMPPLSVDCEALLKKDGPVQGRKLKLPNRYKQHRRTTGSLKREVANIVVGSCNGLICLLLKWGYVVLWNPCTRKVNKLPKQTHVKTHQTFYGFGYDSCTERYKIILGDMPSMPKTLAHMAIFTTSWRNFDDVQIHNEIYGRGCLLNGALHWIESAQWDAIEDDHSGPSRLSIISFDLAEEKFQNLVSLPSLVTQDTSAKVWTSRDSIFVCFWNGTVRTETKLTIWEMKEYGIEDSWTNVGHISFNSHPECYWPLKFFEDGNFLMTICGGLLVYDPEKKTIRSNSDLPILYMETLVSPFTS